MELTGTGVVLSVKDLVAVAVLPARSVWRMVTDFTPSPLFSCHVPKEKAPAVQVVCCPAGASPSITTL